MTEMNSEGTELIILVDPEDKEIGVSDKLLAHQSGQLHRAFSVFIFNSKAELLLQQRAGTKYHSPGLWSNTCCSHPKPGEKTLDACNRRLIQEMGLKCKLEFGFSFTYKFHFSNGLTEHEFDHVYFGSTDDLPELNLNEVIDWKYIRLQALENEISLHPESYTPWLKICLPKIIGHYKHMTDEPDWKV